MIKAARTRNLLVVSVALLVVFLVAIAANGVRIGDVGVSVLAGTWRLIWLFIVPRTEARAQHFERCR